MNADASLDKPTQREPRRPVWTWISRSPEATEELGRVLGRVVPGGTLIALDGELGAGKTTFVRGLARGLDVEDGVTSPSYALLQTYSGRLELHHFDAWMERRERAFLLDGGLEWMRSGGVAAVEWAERVHDALPWPRLHMTFEHQSFTTEDESERRIRAWVAGQGNDADSLAHALEVARAAAHHAGLEPDSSAV